MFLSPPRSLLSFAPGCWLLLGSWVSAIWAAPSGLPIVPAAVFNVVSYGAVGDGTTNNTAAIQAALNAARTAGGIVEFPAAPGSYRSGPITVYSRTNLQVDAGATLQALPFGTYPNSTTSPLVGKCST